jgi:hypothetical protein
MLVFTDFLYLSLIRLEAIWGEKKSSKAAMGGGGEGNAPGVRVNEPKIRVRKDHGRSEAKTH